MKVVILAVMLASPGLATAQSLLTSQPSMNGPNYSTWANNRGTGYGSAITPSMRREQLERARALRTEVGALLSADGGTLTLKHLAYVQRKADAIRSFRH